MRTEKQKDAKEDALEEEMATHSSILAWKIPWTEEPGEVVNGLAKESNTTWTSTTRGLPTFKMPVPVREITKLIGSCGVRGPEHRNNAKFLTC